MNATLSRGARPPLIYVIDYSRQFLDDDANIHAFADAPPDLMHVGKSVPIVHNWGPTRGIHGENQMTGPGSKRGLHWDSIALLSPDELHARIAMLKEYTQKWHDIGVPMLMCYTAIHTICGDHETRQGFWNFYDHWNDYEKWLGSRPDADPLEWMMTDKQGDLVPGACTGFSPPGLAPLRRYRVCPLHPAWRNYQTQLTKLIAEVGYDGVFPDNSTPELHECFCRNCRDGLRSFVRDMSPRQRTILGVDDPESVDMMDPNLSAELLRRYRIEITADYQALVGRAGRSVNPDFKVFPNVCSLEDCMPIGDNSDFFMFESVHAPGCAIATPPPDEPDVAIEVTETIPADAQNLECYVNVYEKAKPARMGGALSFPDQAALGTPVEIGLTVELVGLWFELGEYAHGFELILTHDQTGAQERIAMTPDVKLADPQMGEGFQATPFELTASWTPKTPGRYKLSVAERHGLIDRPDEAAAHAEPNWASQYRTHIAQLMFTMNNKAAPILLDYEARREGMDTALELHIAQCAAFASGGALATPPGPLMDKYYHFFRRTRHLYEGFIPVADIGLLYSYWGHNPVTFAVGDHFEPTLTPATELTRRHRLIQVLCDRTLSPDYLKPLSSLILASHMLEMSDEQIAAIEQFRTQGGALYLYRPDTTINAQPYSDVLGDVPLWTPPTQVTGFAPLLRAQGLQQGLRFSVMKHVSEPRMALHALNYNVAFRHRPAIVTPVPAFSVSIPTPPGLNFNHARLHHPDTTKVTELPLESDAHSVTLALPQLHIYQLIELTV